MKGEDRFDAYVALSPSGPGSIFSADSWSNLHKPLYVLTGTREKASKATGNGALAPTTASRPAVNGSASSTAPLT